MLLRQGASEYVPGSPPVTAFVRADGALYGAKEAGRNRVVALTAIDRPVEAIDRSREAA